MKKKILIAVGALIAVMALMLAIWQSAKPQAVQGGKTVNVTVVHKDQSSKDFEIHTDAENLEDALLQENLVEGTESEYGLYILTVDGETADESNQEWWCITKGGEMLATGARDTMIQDGENYELTLTVGW